VFQHLTAQGLFIVDMYTPRALQYYASADATAYPFAQGYIYDVAEVQGNALTWQFKVFEQVAPDLYRLHTYAWREIIYPISQVKHALSQRFTLVECTPFEAGRRIQFVCQRT
jgi:hypothetical protein